MTTKEAINVLENGKWWDMCDPSLRCENNTAKALHDAIDVAVSALLAQPLQADDGAERRMAEVRALIGWLESEGAERFAISGGGYSGFLIRVKINADVDYLYLQRQAKAEPRRVTGYKYAGIYYRKGRFICDLQSCLGQMLSKESIANLVRSLPFENGTAIRDAVCRRVDELIAADPDKLRIKELTNPDFKERLESCKSEDAKYEARVLCVNGGDYSALDRMFSCGYSIHSVAEEDVLSFLADPEGFADMLAKEYIEKNQERILFGTLCRDVLDKEYKSIMADPKHPAHLMRKISEAVSECSEKRVKVTVRINGTDIRFSEAANRLMQAFSDDKYPLAYLHFTDYDKFQKHFPCVMSYSPKDIISITCGEKVLYQADSQPML